MYVNINITKTPLEVVMKNFRDGVLFNISETEFVKIIAALKLPRCPVVSHEVAETLDPLLSNYLQTVTWLKTLLKEALVSKHHGYISIVSKEITHEHHNLIVRIINLSHKCKYTIVINEEIVYVPDNLICDTYTLNDVAYYYKLSKEKPSKFKLFLDRMFHLII